MTLQVKVCGMRDEKNIEDLRMLNIDYMGFIFYERSERYIQKVPLLSSVGSEIKKIGVFVNSPIDFITQKLEDGLDGIQLHGSETPSICQYFKDKGILVLKAFGIQENFDWQQLEPYIKHVDYFLFDTKSPKHGGTGRTFDWTVLKSYPFDTPYFLSGGLGLENITEALAISDTRLRGLDLNSKFELSPANKDIEKLKKALKIIKDE
ncbi:phosphoribosylanthranilate isomerase [Sphingobacterium sp. LRF_L2]|uniref:phosphoribosylanthranilate isomerase n=1 Tax=Sphingobacterium sp. LRF_L2 TaxID=3369421 RepID=UPI003F61243C